MGDGKKRTEAPTPLAQRLVDERLKRGWSQPKLAEMVPVRGASIWKWEAGRAVPRFHHMVRLAEIFDIALAELAKLAPPAKVHPGKGQATDPKRRTPFASGE